ncbi:MAG: hypothetical protein M3Y80_03585 [Verrucomicrobiota bacterium]|nr:hypothetical protein [Verrucomicrobiota bacterium]
MKTLRSLFFLAVILLAVRGVQATTVIPPTFDQLVGQAQLIFQGSVTDVKSQWIGEGAQRHIVTYVTFQIEDSLKGDAGSSYTIRMLGGTVGDQTMEVSDSPKFKVGDDDILFVENNGSQFIPLVGIMHGRFHVQKDAQTNADVVTSEHGEPLGDLSKLGKEEPATNGGDVGAPIAKSLPLSEFKTAIHAKLDEAH